MLSCFKDVKRILQCCAAGVLLAVVFVFLTCLPAWGAEKENVYVGDSRTVGMHSAVTGLWFDDMNIREDTGVWVAKCGRASTWFKEVGAPQAQKYLNEGNKNLIILMGCNDMPKTSGADVYIKYLKEHEAEFARKNISVYFVSVNPVGHMNGGTETSYRYLSNAGTCEPFNAYLQKNLPSYVKYIDTYSELVKKGYETSDGLHYKKSTYLDIYNAIQDTISLDSVGISRIACESCNVFDYTYYVGNNADAAKECGTDGSTSSIEHAFRYFVTNGLKKGDQASAYFNINDYMELNSGAAAKNGNDALSCLKEYLSTGYNAGRPTLKEEHATIYYGPYYMSHFEELQNTYGRGNGDADWTGLLKHFLRWGISGGLQASEQFNVHAYKNNYAELRGVYGDSYTGYYHHYEYWGAVAGLNAKDFLEYKPVAIKDGIDYSPVYDFEYFRTKYPDVKKAFGDDDAATLANFVRWGMAGGRQGSEEFNVRYYMHNYPNLKAMYGNDLPKYYLHYITTGKAEGLTADKEIDPEPVTIKDGVDYSPVYDFEYFRTKYPDVKNAFGDDAEATLANFVRWGMAGGRQGSEEFNVRYYRHNYLKLSAEFGDDLPKYYMHYITKGKAEGLVADKEIDPKPITVQNDVDYSPVYDFFYFQKKYPDVRAAFGDDDTATLANFIRWGMESGRQGSEEFNVNYYKENYPQLKSVYGSTLAGYYMHYILWGKEAGLVADRLIEKEPVTVQDDIDYSLVYDYNFFTTKYPDVKAAFGSDDVATLANFVRWGIEGGRQGSENFNLQVYKANYPELVSVYGSVNRGYYLHYIRWGHDGGLNAKTLLSDETGDGALVPAGNEESKAKKGQDESGPQSEVELQGQNAPEDPNEAGKPESAQPQEEAENQDEQQPQEEVENQDGQQPQEEAKGQDELQLQEEMEGQNELHLQEHSQEQINTASESGTASSETAAETSSEETDETKGERFVIGGTGIRLVNLDLTNGSFINYGIDLEYDESWSQGKHDPAYMEYTAAGENGTKSLKISRFDITETDSPESWLESRNIEYDPECASEEKIGTETCTYYQTEETGSFMVFRDTEKMYICTFEGFGSDKAEMLKYFEQAEE